MPKNQIVIQASGIQGTPYAVLVIHDSKCLYEWHYATFNEAYEIANSVSLQYHYNITCHILA